MENPVMPIAGCRRVGNSQIAILIVMPTAEKCLNAYVSSSFPLSHNHVLRYSTVITHQSFFVVLWYELIYTCVFQGDPLPAALVELVRNSPISSIEDLQLLLLSDSVGKDQSILLSLLHILKPESGTGVFKDPKSLFTFLF